MASTTGSPTATRPGMLASEWRPRPRSVPRLRQVLADRITDPNWLSSPVLRDNPTIGGSPSINETFARPTCTS
jgi:hypothetical protein